MAGAHEGNAMRAQIVSVGNEVVGGAVADTNAAWLARRLEAMGATVLAHRAVRDMLGEIVQALRDAASAADAVIVTGGLGPTADDLTREAAAELTGSSLVPHEGARRMLEEFFRRRGRAPHPTNLKQASLPEGATWLPNPRGTAAGFALEHGRARLFFLPGVPSEMEGMFNDEVAPRLESLLAGAGGCCRSVTLFGVPESEVGAALGDLMARGANPEVGTMAKTGVIVVRIVARGDHPEAARALADQTVQRVRALFGEHVVGEDVESLAEIVGRRLIAMGRTIALAESCTGGLIAAMLTDVPGISASLMEGVVAYANEAKVRRLGVPAALLQEHGAVSREVAEAMAGGVRAASGADIGLAVTGVAGPGGATPAREGRPAKPIGLVHLALADERGIISAQAQFAGDRGQVRTRAALAALDMVRRRLMETE